MSEPPDEASSGCEQPQPPKATRRRGPRPTRAMPPAEREARAADRFPDDDRYAFRGVLGRGGQGVVFRVFDAELGRDVALKTLLPEASDPELAAQFVEEARATAKLGHPNIIPLFDVGRLPDDRPYYTMQLVTGRSLRDVLRARDEISSTPDPGEEPWSLPRLVQVVVQVCNALDLAHEQGVLHRDVKPANIMLGRFGEVLLVDWGIAKGSGARSSPDAGAKLFPDLVPRETELGTIKGTIPYMAPEALRGEPLTDRSDVYAVGVVLHEILTGRLPFDADTTDELVRRVLEDPLPPRDAVDPARPVPPALWDLVVRALARDPAERVATAHELGRTLQVYLEDESDREKRLAAAATLREEGRAALALHEETVREAEALERILADLEAVHPPWQPVKDKAPLIAARARARALERSRWTSFVDAANRFTDALAQVPDEPGVRQELTDLFWPRFLDAEHDGRELEAVTYRKLVERFHDVRLAVELAGDGSLELSVSPDHAELTLHPLVEQGIALVDGPGESLGRGDVRLERLPMGSYVIVATAQGHETVRYPVCIERCTHWVGELRLPPAGSLPPGFVFVPGTTAWQGGDLLARKPSPLRKVQVRSFLMAEHLVTFGEYCEFLDATVEEPDHEALVPRVASFDGPLCTPGPAGKFEALPLVEVSSHFVDTYGLAALPRVPVLGVSRILAERYAAWRSRVGGRPFRLPTGEEWELAARGVDRRIYPWGNVWDDAACHSYLCFPDEGDQAPVGLFETDVGPHGVKGLAGELGEWTGSWYDEKRQLVEIRGGAWNLSERACRVAGLVSGNAGDRSASLGFRLAADP